MVKLTESSANCWVTGYCWRAWLIWWLDLCIEWVTVRTSFKWLIGMVSGLANLLTHSLTHTLTHSHSLTHSLSHSLTHSLTHYSLSHSLTHHFGSLVWYHWLELLSNSPVHVLCVPCSAECFWLPVQNTVPNTCQYRTHPSLRHLMYNPAVMQPFCTKNMDQLVWMLVFSACFCTLWLFQKWMCLGKEENISQWQPSR